DNDAAIVYTSIDLTHNLGLHVVAEGVDDEGVLNRLRVHGCDAAQGMYLSRPLSGNELVDWLGKSKWGMPVKAVC
ncbi:MAG: EAL domain-containing protein, partial [Sulfurifustaceae bacterium]